MSGTCVLFGCKWEFTSDFYGVFFCLSFIRTSVGYSVNILFLKYVLHISQVE